MTKVSIGAVEASLGLQPDTKRLSDKSSGEVIIKYRNYSVLSLDINIRDVLVANRRVAEVSAGVPMSVFVNGRSSRRSAGNPYEGEHRIGTWTTNAEHGDTEIKVEVQGVVGGAAMLDTNGWIEALAFVTP